MFFWNRVDQQNLEAILTQLENVKSIFISVAFCSLGGTKFIKQLITRCAVERDKVEFVLNKCFSNRNCSEILETLNRIGRVYLKKEGGFHPKAYIFEHFDDTSTLVLGSANLTMGGLKENLEFCEARRITEQLPELKGFRAVSKYGSVEVTDEIIRAYKKYESEIAELSAATLSLENIADEALGIHQESPLRKEDLVFEDHLFVFEDYELFFPKFAKSVDRAIIQKRETVQEKLLSILPTIMKHVNNKGYELHTHWDKNHITSLIHPTIYNRFSVDWLGVRLGKAKSEIDVFRNETDYGHTNDYGFQKHSCFQYSLFKDCFWVGIFHAVPYGAVDRYYLHEKIRDPSYQEKLIQTLKCIFR